MSRLGLMGFLRRLRPRKRETERYLVFARGIPACEWSAALFRRRPGRSSLVGEWLSRVCGTIRAEDSIQPN
ncbi:hypothetical protein MPNT_70062 [Candidatus Methylacidithermus pantelleriae]|uniref:Uncharacterized protein n=1 Tax=Candidatus Methylacidithermus pantelleriae TaxID=2744239 RepID=A0A8J2BSM9_9BACT|nr:hypothetical protein MPNT_70062 [Candidatus Methylacidithermus pantelleriae]